MKNIRSIIIALSLLLISKYSYSQNQPFGYLDVVHPLEGFQGWAYDPDYPNTSIAVHFYANAPAGSPGSVFIGSTQANIYRSDVGYKGFLWYPPVDLNTRCRPTIYAYGIDLNGNGNPNLNNSPRLMPFLTGVISAPVEGLGLSMRTSSKYAGAIYSLEWDGVQFIDTYDHGRQLQSSCGFYETTNFDGSQIQECYNPNEAGSYADGIGNCSSSEMLEFYTYPFEPNKLKTKTQMAFWAPPGGFSGACSSGINTSILSDYIFGKEVTIGVPGIPQAIEYKVSFTVPTNETRLAEGQFEVLTAYTTSTFKKFWKYDQLNNIWSDATSRSDQEYIEPLILSDVSGQHAIGIYCPHIHNNSVTLSHPLSMYGQFKYGNSWKWNAVVRETGIIPGKTYNYTAYVAVGRLANVMTTIQQLIQTFPNP